YFSDPALGDDFQRAVFVDPYTGRILGDEPTWFGYLPLSTWLDGLHRHLQLGEPGRVYSELAASWLWVVALGGLYLWLVRPAASRLARRRSARQRSLRLHGRVGIWVLVMLLFLSATGITWSTYAGAHVSDIRTALHWQRPALDTATTVHHDGHGHMSPAAGTTDLDRVVATADAAGVHAPVELTLPADGGEPVSVTEIDAPFRLTTNAAAVDPQTSTVVAAIDYWRDYSVIAMLADWGIRLHMGFLFGLANQLLLLGVAVATVVLIVVGYRMWWQRRPTRGARWRAGRTPRRGVLRALSLPAVAGVAAGTLAIGWFLPLLGLSLLGFLLVDAGVGMLQRRRATQLG
ncbi:MAG TPA: PepSY-associated TM helix domain-containing protein, partial [Mycobacterium sp.]|nr:PepSY-associated TM helix domain-containing protein [Mycobacterium sp.]